MAALRVTVDVREITTYQRRLDVASRVDTRTLVDRLLDVSLAQTQRRYDRRVDPFGRPWPPRVDNLPHPLLEKSGALRRSIATQVATATEGELGTSGIPYAAIHQFGGGRIPPRPYLGYGPDDLLEIEDESDLWLERFVAPVLR